MNYTEEELRDLMDQHDGHHGYANMMCRSCEVIHPCPVFRLGQDVLEARRLREAV